MKLIIMCILTVGSMVFGLCQMSYQYSEAVNNGGLTQSAEIIVANYRSPAVIE